MIEIYICDDEQYMLEQIEQIIRSQILIEGYDMQPVLCSTEPEQILERVKKSGRSGIYFLDVELKGKKLDGFALGKEIRSYDAGGTIVYITAFKDLAFRTFQYHIEAFDYIVKGGKEEMQASVAKCLKEVAERLADSSVNGHREYFMIKIMDIVKYIPVDEIYYFETSSRAHKVYLCAQQECLEFPGSLKEIEAGLGKDFMRIHRAFLVNLKQICEFDLKEKQVVMKNGQKCMVARNMKSELFRRLGG